MGFFFIIINPVVIVNRGGEKHVWMLSCVHAYMLYGQKSVDKTFATKVKAENCVYNVSLCRNITIYNFHSLELNILQDDCAPVHKTRSRKVGMGDL